MLRMIQDSEGMVRSAPMSPFDPDTEGDGSGMGCRGLTARKTVDLSSLMETLSQQDDDMPPPPLPDSTLLSPPEHRTTTSRLNHSRDAPFFMPPRMHPSQQIAPFAGLQLRNHLTTSAAPASSLKRPESMSASSRASLSELEPTTFDRMPRKNSLGHSTRSFAPPPVFLPPRQMASSRSSLVERGRRGAGTRSMSAGLESGRRAQDLPYGDVIAYGMMHPGLMGGSSVPGVAYGFVPNPFGMAMPPLPLHHPHSHSLGLRLKLEEETVPKDQDQDQDQGDVVATMEKTPPQQVQNSHHQRFSPSRLPPPPPIPPSLPPPTTMRIPSPPKQTRSCSRSRGRGRGGGGGNRSKDGSIMAHRSVSNQSTQKASNPKENTRRHVPVAVPLVPIMFSDTLGLHRVACGGGAAAASVVAPPLPPPPPVGRLPKRPIQIRKRVEKDSDSDYQDEDEEEEEESIRKVVKVRAASKRRNVIRRKKRKTVRRGRGRLNPQKRNLVRQKRRKRGGPTRRRKNANAMLRRRNRGRGRVRHDEEEEEEDESEIDIDVGDNGASRIVCRLKPSRRKNTDYAPIGVVPEQLCSSPYKYLLKIAHDLDDGIVATNFEVFLSPEPRRGDNLEFTLPVRLSEGVEFEFLRTTVEGRSQVHFYHVQFTLTSFMNASERYILNVATVGTRRPSVFLRTRPFILVARKDKALDDAFWNRYLLDATKRGGNTCGRKKGCQMTGRKRKRTEEEVADDLTWADDVDDDYVVQPPRKRRRRAKKPIVDEDVQYEEEEEDDEGDDD